MQALVAVAKTFNTRLSTQARLLALSVDTRSEGFCEMLPNLMR